MHQVPRADQIELADAIAEGARRRPAQAFGEYSRTRADRRGARRGLRRRLRAAQDAGSIRPRLDRLFDCLENVRRRCPVGSHTPAHQRRSSDIRTSYSERRCDTGVRLRGDQQASAVEQQLVRALRNVELRRHLCARRHRRSAHRPAMRRTRACHRSRRCHPRRPRPLECSCPRSPSRQRPPARQSGPRRRRWPPFAVRQRQWPPPSWAPDRRSSSTGRHPDPTPSLVATPRSACTPAGRGTRRRIGASMTRTY